MQQQALEQFLAVAKDAAQSRHYSKQTGCSRKSSKPRPTLSI
jgi:hypothetical protein